MPRRKIPDIGQTAHITIRSNNREFLFNLETNFNDIVSWFNSLPCFFNISIHHILFMSNHIHLLATAHKVKINLGMSYLLTNLSKFLNHRNKRINHVFGNRYAPTVILNEKHYINVIRYIYQNPVRAGLTRSVIDYPYSSLGFYTGESNRGLFIDPDPYTADLFKHGLSGRSQWIAEITNELEGEDTRLMKQMLMKSRFRYSRQNLLSLSQRKSTLMV